MQNQHHLLALFSLLSLLITTVHSQTPSQPAASNGTDDYIRTSCNTTLYPEVCYASLSRYASAVQQDPARLARAAVSLTMSRARRAASFVSSLSHQADYGNDRRAASALHDCLSNLGDAVDEVRASLKQLRQMVTVRAGGGGSSFGFMMSNVQTWMSAALTDEETCTDGFDDVAVASALKDEVTGRVAEVKKFTSNALALVNSYAASVIS